MRASSAVAKRERLAVRITSEQKKLIEEAANLEGRSLTDFIVSSVEKAARDSIVAHRVISLSVRDSEKFFAAISNPPEPSPRLLEAAREYQEFVGD